MSSTWGRKSRAWFLKELRCELRSKHGLFTSGLFGLMAVVVAVFATFDQILPPKVASAFLCLVLLFTTVATVPRIFLVEEDQRTFDLARLMADPSVIYSGKALFAVALNALAGLVLSSVFVGMTENPLARWDVLLFGSVLFTVGLTLSLCVCSALVIGAENRYVLAGVVALPLLVPLVFCGVGALNFAFGEGPWGAALRNLVVLGGYTVGLATIGPVLVDAVWGRRRDPDTSGGLPHNKEEA